MLIIRSRSNRHSLGNHLPQARAIACRGPEDHCHLLFHIGQQTPGRQWKESVVFCSLCLSALPLGIIRIIKIIVKINIIGIIEILVMSKILPGLTETPRLLRRRSCLLETSGRYGTAAAMVSMSYSWRLARRRSRFLQV